MRYPDIAAQTNKECGGVVFQLPQGYNGKVYIWIEVRGNNDLNSEYIYLCRSSEIAKLKQAMLNM